MKLIIIFKIGIPLIFNDLNIFKKRFSICIRANTAVNRFVGNIHIIEFCQYIYPIFINRIASTIPS